MKYMKIALKEANKAFNKGDVPVGACLIYEGKVIAKAYNTKESNNNATHHAEILVINKACKKLKTWHLEDCILYTTVEPCLMCSGAIVQSRIKKLVYAIQNDNFGGAEYIKKYNKKIIIEKGLMEEEAKELLQKFFKEKRK